MTNPQQEQPQMMYNEMGQLVPKDQASYDMYMRSQKQKQIGNSVGGIAGVGAALGIQAYQNSNSGSKRYGGMQYPHGGMINGNAELEKQENTLNPDGSTEQFNGPSHEQGGIPTQLDPGTLVFSDKLKLGKKTFADLNKPNMTIKEDKILDNKKSNATQRLTAELMKGAKNKQSVALYKAQEGLKATKVYNYAKRLGIDPNGLEMRNGGIVRRYDNGGTPYGPQPYGSSYQMPGIMQMGYYPGLYDKTMQGIGLGNTANNPVGPQPNTGGFAPYALSSDPNAYQNALAKVGQDNYWPGGSYNGPNNIGFSLLDSNPTAMAIKAGTGSIDPSAQSGPGTEKGITEDPVTGTSTDYSPYLKAAGQLGLGLAQNIGNFYDLKRAKTVDKETYNRVTPEKLDPTATLRDNARMFRKGAEDIKNASNGNSSTYIQNRKGLAIDNIYANDRIRKEYANANAQIQNQANYYNAGTGDRETIANMQNQAQARNLKSNAYSNIGHNIYSQGSTLMREGNAKQSQDTYLKILAARYPEMLNDPEYKKMFEGK
jgi:hypothetical protein